MVGAITARVAIGVCILVFMLVLLMPPNTMTWAGLLPFSVRLFHTRFARIGVVMTCTVWWLHGLRILPCDICGLFSRAASWANDSSTSLQGAGRPTWQATFVLGPSFYLVPQAQDKTSARATRMPSMIGPGNLGLSSRIRTQGDRTSRAQHNRHLVTECVLARAA